VAPIPGFARWYSGRALACRDARLPSRPDLASLGAEIGRSSVSAQMLLRLRKESASPTPLGAARALEKLTRLNAEDSAERLEHRRRQASELPPLTVEAVGERHADSARGGLCQCIGRELAFVEEFGNAEAHADQVSCYCTA